MATEHIRHEVPSDYARWWSLSLQPWWRDHDYLGHVTAASYAVIVEEAVGRYLQDRWDRPDPTYVVAHLSISYLREIRMGDGPLNVFVSSRHAGGSRFECTSVIVAADGTPRSVAHGLYAGWDSARRGSRDLTEQESRALGPADS